MPWGELKREDLKNAGLDPDEFKKVSDKIATAATQDDINALKNSLTETQNTLKELGNTLQTLATKPNSDGGNKDQSGGGNSGGGGNGGNGGPQPLKIDPLEFMEDPQTAVRRLTQEALAPVTLHTLNVAADMAYNMARQRLPHFDKFEAEIKGLWDKYTPLQKGKPDELIENIYNLVRGRHLDEIITDSNKKEGKYNLVQSGGTTVMGPAGGGGGSRKPEEDLSPKELEIAARFGMTPEQWAKEKGGLKYV